jgi:hypothetical protein
MEESNPITEAMRYIDNARALLSEKAGKDGNYYRFRATFIKMMIDEVK